MGAAIVTIAPWSPFNFHSLALFDPRLIPIGETSNVAGAVNVSSR